MFPSQATFKPSSQFYIFLRHSVDSAVSLRSQLHADRIRWPPRLRSVSDLELAYRPRPRPQPQPGAPAPGPAPAQPPEPPRTADLEYLDNPAENLEFANRRLQRGPPRPRVDDEYYRHLTARSQQERWWQLSNPAQPSPAQPGPAQPSTVPPCPGLRRSRSLAVIREEACTGPLIPRARLADRPVYKERAPSRSKYQTKEEALERIYNKSNSSCYGDISDNPNHPPDEPNLTTAEGLYEDTSVYKGGKQTNGWAPSTGVHLNLQPPEDATYSRNASEIDSLDSNYIHKNYNFEGNHAVSKESSPETTDQPYAVPLRSKPLFIRTEVISINNDVTSDYYLPDYNQGDKSDSIGSSNSSANGSHTKKSQTNFNVLENFTSDDNEPDSCEEHFVDKKVIISKTITKPTCKKSSVELTNSGEELNRSLETTTTVHDKDSLSVTSYITVPSSPESPPRRLENLAVSLAEKIDEYCESKYSENIIEIPLHLQSAGNSFNNKSFDDLKSIYTQVNKIRSPLKIQDKSSKYTHTLERYQKQSNLKDSPQYGRHEEFKTRSLYRQSSSSKNITTEPFVTTLIENQYFSLPDINISNGLKQSEKIDAKLREQDKEIPKIGYVKRLEASQELNRIKDFNLYEKRENYTFEINDDESESDFCDDSLNTINDVNDSIISEIEENTANSSSKENLHNLVKNRSDIFETKSNDNFSAFKNCVEVTIHGDTKEVKKYSNLKEANENKKHSLIFHNPLNECVSVNNLKKIFVTDSHETVSETSIILSQAESDTSGASCHSYKWNENKNFELSKSNEEITKKNESKEKKRNQVTKHYSLRQREPKPDLKSLDTIAPPSPPNELSTTNESANYCSSNNSNSILQVKDLTYFSSNVHDALRKESQQSSIYNNFQNKEINILNRNAKEGTNVTILPLSGHRTIVVESTQLNKFPCAERNNEQGGKSLPPDNLSAFQDFLNEPTNHQKQQRANEHSEETHLDATPESASNLQSEINTFEEVKRKVIREIPRVKKERSTKIAAVQNKFERPPTRLIIKDKKILGLKISEMSRPQVLTIKDNRYGRLESEGNTTTKTQHPESDTKASKLTNSTCNNESFKTNPENLNKTNIFNVTEKIDDAVKTDIEYQEKLHSVKNYWSKLIENKPDEKQEIEDLYENIENLRECLPDDIHTNQVTSVEDIIKNIETVKIVDSIKKVGSQSESDVWKKEGGPENEKSESVIEEGPIKRILGESGKFMENACNTLKETLTLASMNCSDSPVDAETNPKESDFKSFSPDIEIVELGTNNVNGEESETKHATLIKSKSYNQDCSDFDHVRYKIMKSDLFRKSMVANYKKEAQFDGLLQYLQDYSFQELLVNNNIVIIEPVRTKIEQKDNIKTSTKHSNECHVTGPTSKQSENKSGDKETKQRKSKSSGLKRHFFYHPIRVNKEIIEEELPNPDTVKTVRDLFEGTLRMRRPEDNSDPCILSDSTSSMSKRSTSHKNLSVDTKLDKSGSRKKGMRFLTIDTSYGQKKWDSASLSSGVSSGDLSSNNDHDYDTDALSPFQSTKVNNDHIYSSSSEEYLCESLNPSLCYESQYVSQDILQKIRECGTSITYYGGKVLNERRGPAVSPMTKAIMDEIRGLQRSCCRDCSVCQTKCTEDKCACLDPIVIEKNEQTDIDDADRLSKCCSCIEITEKNDSCEKTERNGDNYLGFKFKLVKSNSCSSRLELAGTGEDKNQKRFYKPKNNKSYKDPPPNYDKEHSVKTKICRIESYRKGMVASPFSELDKDDSLNQCDGNNAPSDGASCIVKKETPFNGNTQKNNSKDQITVTEATVIDESKISRSKNVDLACKKSEVKNIEKGSSNETLNVENTQENLPGQGEEDQKSVADAIKTFNDPISYEKKFYYVNSDTSKINDKKNSSKFGEMVFEEFEVYEPNM